MSETYTHTLPVDTPARPPLTTRPPRAEDAALLLDSWVKSSRIRLARQDALVLHHDLMTAAVARVLQRPGIVARIAERGDQVVGWAVCERPDVVWYAYVRNTERDRGLCRMLVRACLGDRVASLQIYAEPEPRWVDRLRRLGHTVAVHALVVEAMRDGV